MKIALSCPSVRYYSIDIRSDTFSNTDEKEAKEAARVDFIEKLFWTLDVLQALYVCEGGCLMRVGYAASDDQSPAAGEYVSQIVAGNPNKHEVHASGKRPYVVACLDPEMFPTGHLPDDEDRIVAHMAQLVKYVRDGKDAAGHLLILETGRQLSCPGEQELTVDVVAAGVSDKSAADARIEFQRAFSGRKRAYERLLEQFFSCEQTAGGKCAATPTAAETHQGPVTLNERKEDAWWMASSSVEVTFMITCRQK